MDKTYLLAQCRFSAKKGLQPKELVVKLTISRPPNPTMSLTSHQQKTEHHHAGKLHSQSPHSLLGLPEPDLALPKASKSMPLRAAMAYALALYVSENPAVAP
jgi:hypothetical protein